MPVHIDAYKKTLSELSAKNIELVAVSKTRTAEDIFELYDAGQRDFGENYVQELIEKYRVLPKDIHWHFIGHLQTNKVKLIVPFVLLIQSVDSLKLLKEINKEGEKNHRRINCLLQVHIAKEETKFGMDEDELNSAIGQFDNLEMKYVNITGLMGMASFTDDMNKVRNEFKYLKLLFEKYKIQNTKIEIQNLELQTNFKLQTLSMGMSADYKIAVEEGSNMVRIGSLLFGERK